MMATGGHSAVTLGTEDLDYNPQANLRASTTFWHVCPARTPCRLPARQLGRQQRRRQLVQAQLTAERSSSSQLANIDWDTLGFGLLHVAPVRGASLQPPPLPGALCGCRPYGVDMPPAQLALVLHL